MDASPPLSIPRLRLPRHSPQYKDQSLTPIAGPSHNPDLLHADDDDDEDAESTPRMSSSAVLDRQSPRAPASPSLPADNPTARLRALLSRVPNSSNSATPHARPLVLPSSSEPESDFEPPHSLTTSRIARESLKELFSHALREPGNTPQKNGRPRRNSIDASEVEATPRVEEERASYKAKRRSLSDEEGDKSRYMDSDLSSRSSAASAFDALRQRLNQSTSVMPSFPQEPMVMDMSMPPPNSSTDTAMFPAGLVDTPSETPPRATSTPMRTFQMSMNMNMHSNLLDQDSEMRNALQGMESFESAPVPRHKHSSTPALKHSAGPTPRPQPHGSSPARPLSWSSHSKSHSINNLPPVVRRGSEDLDTSSSRASSSLSGADYHERQGETKREQIHERERGWNSPVPKISKSAAQVGKHDLTHRHSWGSPGNGHASPIRGLSRKSSAASLTSTDDGRSSSRASSVVSRSEYKERVHELDEERVKERERLWNRPNPQLKRSTSNLSLNKSERVRTTSTPSRPDSAASFLSPTTLHRRGSLSPLSHSRPASPNGSLSGIDIEHEIEHEIEHLRERNWNSHRPEWSISHHGRPHSPLPRSRPGSPTGSPAYAQTTTPRSRTNSITHGNSLSVPSSIPRSKSPVGERVPRPRSPMLRSSLDSSHTRPKSPVPRPLPPEKPEHPQNGYQSRFGWSFPKVALPPLELDEESPQRPLRRRTSHLSLPSGSKTPSHIPVRSPGKNGHDSTVSASNGSEKKRSHRRSITEFTESVGSIPPRIEVSSIDDLAPVPIVDGLDEYSSASEDVPQKSTGPSTEKPIPSPQPEITTTPTSKPPTGLLNGRTSQEQDIQPRPGSPLVSPPLTPPDAESQPMFSLQTPPKRPQFFTPKAQFETPPPPRGMPELPGPPSSEDEGEGDHTPVIDSRDVLQSDLTAMKTPRPPGAWMATPAPARQHIKDVVERSSSAPPPDFNSTTSSDSGLATPPSTLSRANTLPPQTPAPPGGWVATPAPSTSAKRRGSLLKVRFDIESETASEGAFEQTPDASLESEVQPQNTDSLSAPQNGDASQTSSSPRADSSSVGAPATPPSLRDRIRKKSPGIRVLDAYGREQTEPEVVSAPVETPSKHVVLAPLDRAPFTSTPRQDARAASTATPRSRSAVRMVDAMGREIEEGSVVEEASSFNLGPLSHGEAVSRIRSQVLSMREELSDADRSSDNAFDERMYVALQEKCDAAQLARTKITQSLQMVQGSDSELKGKSNDAQFRNKLGMTTLLRIGGADTKITWNLFNWRSITTFIVLQLLLLFVMYRYSVTQARRMFLTTYYDAFSPELYIHLFTPDTTSYPIPTCPSWSIFTVFNSVKRAGWSGIITDAWASASCAMSAYLQPSWHYSSDMVSHSWPPT